MLKTIPCDMCGAMFPKDGNRAKFCPNCRPQMKKIYKKDFHDRNPNYKLLYDREYRKWLKGDDEE